MQQPATHSSNRPDERGIDTMSAMRTESPALNDDVRRSPKYILNIDKLTQIPAEEREKLKEVAKKFAFRTNEYYVGLIDWSDPNDPIRKLVIPQERELLEWGKLDASNEASITVCPGVQHKYESTVLLLVTQVCGAYCRYCFRKRLFMNENHEVPYDITPGLDYIRNHPEVSNILLTGGDPMILQTPRLEYILSSLRAIDHVKIIRIGTKIPAFNPYRFLNDDALMDLFRKYSTPEKRIYMMCHFDHVRELTGETREAIRRIREAGVVCVNQNPIIRGISDSSQSLASLWSELSYIGVPQYYVFQGRPTSGNEPYELPIVESYFTVEEAKKKCSGLAKRAKYCMSHESGKVEIMAVDDKYIYLKYHQAKHAEDAQRFFICHRNDTAYWLDQLKPVDGHRNDYYRADAQ
ncbi:MAG: KamA family radical SAM protein [Candidatus Zixiibacteriota bacterium]